MVSEPGFTASVKVGRLITYVAEPIALVLKPGAMAMASMV